ncbi:MAG: hypothetical protein VZR11_09860 [Succinimonas sp.]|nr:hypothetical protein [Succinimonas sp.]
MPNYLAIKTTGKDPASDEVLEISVIDENGRELFASLVKPEHHRSWSEYLPAAAITPEMTADYPAFSEIIPFIQKVTAGKTLFVFDKEMVSGFLGDALSKARRVIDLKEGMLKNLDKKPIFNALSTLIGFEDPEKLVRILNNVVELVSYLHPTPIEEIKSGRANGEAFAVWGLKQFLFEFTGCNKNSDDDDSDEDNSSKDGIVPLDAIFDNPGNTIISSIAPGGRSDRHGSVVTSCIEIGSAEAKRNFCRMVAEAIIKLKCRETQQGITPEQYWDTEYAGLSTAEIIQKASSSEGLNFRSMISDVVKDLPDEEIVQTDIPEIFDIALARDITEDNLSAFENWELRGMILSGDAQDKLNALLKKQAQENSADKKKS